MSDTLPFDPTAPKELPKPGPRKPLSKFDFASLFLEQGGKCYICSGKLVRGQIIDEHVVPRETLPADRCDDMENRRLACKPCATAKTKTDQAVIAKGRALRGERGSQWAKRKARGKSSITGRTEIAKRGFQKPKDGKFDWKKGRYVRS